MPSGRSGGAAFVDWFFRDRRSGAIVIAQWPNGPLWLFAAATASAWGADAMRPASPDWLGEAFRLAATASLVVWAVDEIARGVNPWRRTLGGAVLLLCGWSLAARL